MPPLPAGLETSRPNKRRSEGARTFWYGPPSFRAPRRVGHRSRLRRAPRGYRLCLQRLQEQVQDRLAGIEAVLQTSPAVALDKKAPVGGEGRGSDIPLALSSEVGTQGTNRVRARPFPISPFQSGLERRIQERARPHADAFWRLGRATSEIFITLLPRISYPAPHIVFG
eukprot:6196655-Pleurochrysis_carterae.AAC.1